MSRIFLPPYDTSCDRFPRQQLEKIKRYSNEYFWNAQYLQNDSMAGLIYADLTRCPRVDRPRIDSWWCGCDFANTATTEGSRTAFVAVGFDEQGGRLAVIGAEWGRWRQDEMLDKLYQFVLAMQRLTGRPALKVIVEKAAGGYGVLDLMRHTLPQMEPITPKGSKESRMGDVCPLINRGQLTLPTTATWLPEFEKEVGGFPLEKNDDIADALVHCLKFAISPDEFKEPPPQEGLMVYDSGGGGWEGMPSIGGNDEGDSLESSDEFRRMLGGGAQFEPRTRSFDSEHERLDNNLLDAIDPERKGRY